MMTSHLKGLLTTFVDRCLQVHYHEWPLYDGQGNYIGYEFTTTRGAGVTFVADTLKAQKCETEQMIVETYDPHHTE